MNEKKNEKFKRKTEEYILTVVKIRIVWTI